MEPQAPVAALAVVPALPVVGVRVSPAAPVAVAPVAHPEWALVLSAVAAVVAVAARVPALKVPSDVKAALVAADASRRSSVGKSSMR